jgi:hypothetical protein
MKLITQLKGVDTVSLKTRAMIAAAALGAKFGVSEGAQILVDEARALVPRDTGLLENYGIHSELLESTDTRFVVAVAPAWSADNIYGFEPAYARRIEYGFIGYDSLGRYYHNAAQPFMRPAWDGRHQEVYETIRDSIYQELEGVRH